MKVKQNKWGHLLTTFSSTKGAANQYNTKALTKNSCKMQQRTQTVLNRALLCVQSFPESCNQHIQARQVALQGRH